MVGAATYRVHRLVLTYSSEFFASLLTSDFKESSQSSYVRVFFSLSLSPSLGWY